MMFRILRFIGYALLICITSLWIWAQFPSGKNIIIVAMSSALSRTTGMSASIEDINLSVPFVVRAKNVRIFDPLTKKELLSCERCSIFSLWLDIFTGHVTVFRASARGLTLDLDMCEHFLDSSSAFPINAFSIYSCSLSSIRIKSHRLPNRTFDGSLSGKCFFSFLNKKSHFSVRVRNSSPGSWPQRFDIDLRGNNLSYTVRSTVLLSKNASSLRRISQKDSHFTCQLAVVLRPSASSFTMDSIDQAVGSWSLLYPGMNIDYRSYAIRGICQAKGKISYLPHKDISLTVDELVGAASLLQQIPIDSTSLETNISSTTRLLKTSSLRAEGSIRCLKTQNNTVIFRYSFPKIHIDESIGDISGEVDLCPSPKSLKARVTGKGKMISSSFTYPIEITAQADLSQQNSQTNIQIAASPLVFESQFSRNGGESSLWTRFLCHDLSTINTILPLGLSGTGEISLQRSGTNTKTILSAHLSDASFKTIHCGQADIVLTSSDETFERSVVTADCASLSIGPVQMSQVHTVTSIDTAAHFFQVQDGRIMGAVRNMPFDLSYTAEGKLDDNHFWMIIDRLKGKLDEKPFSNDSPIQLEWNPWGISIPSFAFSLGDAGHGELSWHHLDKERASGQITLHEIPIEPIAKAFNLPQTSGKANGQFHYIASDGQVQASGNAQVSMSLGSGVNQIGLSLATQGGIEGGRFKATLCLAGKGIHEPLMAALDCPVRATPGTPFCTLEHRSSAWGSIQGELHLAEVLPHVIQTEIGVDGIMSCNAHISGAISSPSLTGHFSLKEGVIDSLPTGMVISDIEMDGDFCNESLILTRITAADGNIGRISGDGKVSGWQAHSCTWEMNLLCHDVEAVKLDYAAATADGTIKLLGTPSSLRISGTAIAKKALIDVAARFPSEVPEIPFIFKGQPVEKTTPFTVFFDLVIDGSPAGGSNGVCIRGRGLDSTWLGLVRLTGPHNALRVAGSLRCDQGKFTLAGKDLKITEGTISVMGDLFKDTRLNVSAGVDLPSVSAKLLLKGSLENPRFSLQSTPPRSENEIFSLLLFNKEYGDISPLESLQLAHAAASLDQSSGPFDLIDRFKQTFGIDSIDIGASPSSMPKTKSTLLSDPTKDGPSPSQNGDTTLKVGKFLSEGVSVNVSRDVSANANRIGISAEVAKNITAEAEIGDDESGIFSIKWKKNY